MVKNSHVCKKYPCAIYVIYVGLIFCVFAKFPGNYLLCEFNVFDSNNFPKCKYMIWLLHCLIGQDGKAGMACLVLNEGNTDLTDSMCKSIYKVCVKSLPSYARPLFLRVQGQMVLTATYKQRKVELVQQGFDPTKINDPLYCLDTAKKSYVPLNNQQYTRILIGHSRL